MRDVDNVLLREFSVVFGSQIKPE